MGVEPGDQTIYRGGNVIRYLRLFGYFVRFSISRAMEFRLDFFFRIVMDLLYYGVNIAFYRVIFLHTSNLGGWTEPQIMVFVSIYLLIDAIHMTLFSNNIWWLPTYINRGDLDYYIVRPVSSLFFVSLRDFAANSFVNLILAFGISIWALESLPGGLSAGRVFIYYALALNGTFVSYLIYLLMLLPVFWTHSGRGLEYFHMAVSKFQERPDRIFSGWIHRVIVSVLPLALVASFPARLVLERFDLSLFAHLVAVTSILFGVTVAIWRRGLRNYSSASS